MLSRIFFASAILCTFSHAGVRSGKAVVDLLATSTTYEAGKPVEVAVRLKVDREWHTYWSNPGEGGMKLAVKWSLPPGWKASEPLFPVPKSFHTGGLAGFGYEGTVLFPITLTPPADAVSEVQPSAKISWLTCNDDACVPGNATLSLSLAVGAPAGTPDAEIVHGAFASIPRPLEGATLDVTENGKDLLLKLSVPAMNPSEAKVFPETPQAIDPAATIQFRKDGDVWVASVPKNEYATAPLKTLTLVIAGEGAPATVTWTSESP